MRRVSFSITEWTGDLASRLDWVASPSCELTEWSDWTFCPVVLQLAWWFNFSACFTHVHLLAACKPRAISKIQPRVPASLHSFEYFFTFSHTLPLHDSHLNTGFLSTELQVNWHGIKPTKWLIKFNLTSLNGNMVSLLKTWINFLSECNSWFYCTIKILMFSIWLYLFF